MTSDGRLELHRDPPDCGGAVGPDKVMQGLNNNYRILNKADGSVVSTVGTATFWAPTRTALNGLTDRARSTIPTTIAGSSRCRRDPGGDILIGVSQTSDPSGAWNLYRFAVGSTIDFPIVGFNKNWVVVAISKYTTAEPLRPASRWSATMASFARVRSPRLCSRRAPASLLHGAVRHVFDDLGYALPGDPPEQRKRHLRRRPHHGHSVDACLHEWRDAHALGEWLPAQRPGAAAIGAQFRGQHLRRDPCLIEIQDAQVRSAPVYRAGSICYPQTIGLPSGGVMSHSAVQWTSSDADRGHARRRPHRGPDRDRDERRKVVRLSAHRGERFGRFHRRLFAVLLGAASRVRLFRAPGRRCRRHDSRSADLQGGRGLLPQGFRQRTEPLGDFSQAQVDPSDDLSLWVIDEYAKNRTGTNDGTTGSNSSRWSTYWAKVPLAPPTVTLGTGPSLNRATAARRR
jgi:hypothetical protein